jgi:hypothetical protein
MYPYQAQPYQQVNMNPQGGFPPNNASGYMPQQLSMYQQQPSAPPPPPPYSAEDPYGQPSKSSGLYPQFN